MAEISERMKEFLQDYVPELDQESVRHDVALIYPWFPAEFEELLRAHAFTPSVFGKAIGSQQFDTPDGWRDMDSTFRRLWHAVYPDRIYPYDEPGATPSELVDTTDERGVSRRLSYMLGRDYRRNDPVSIDAATVGRTVRGGSWSWLPNTLEAQIKARVLTPKVWSELIYDGDPSIEESTVDRDLRELWAEVAPGRPYPLDVE